MSSAITSISDLAFGLDNMTTDLSEKFALIWSNALIVKTASP